MSTILAQLSTAEIDWTPLAVAAGTALFGLVMWLWGRQVLRPLLICTGVLCGVVIGFLAAPMDSAAESSATAGALGGWTLVYVCMGFGAVLGAATGFLLYRGFLACVMSIALGAVCGAAAWTAVVLAGGAEPAARPDEAGSAARSAEPAESERATPLVELQRRLRLQAWQVVSGTGPVGASPDDEAGEEQRDDLRRIISDGTGRAQSAVAALTGEAGTAWRGLLPWGRVLVGGLWLVGTAGGLLLGVIFPRWSAGAVTAGVGSLLWLGAALWASDRFGLDWAARTEAWGIGWAPIWAVLALLGAAWQWRGLRAPPRPKQPS